MDWITFAYELEFIYPKLYEELLEESKRQYPSRPVEETSMRSLGGVFNWSQARLGPNFWSHVQANNWDKLERTHPSLFVKYVKKDKVEGAEISNNGLFR